MILAVDPVTPRIRPVGDRRQPPRRNERPFPSVRDEEQTGEDEQDPAANEDSGRDSDRDPGRTDRHPPTSEDDEHTIDLIVAGRLLPTRQILPGHSSALGAH